MNNNKNNNLKKSIIRTLFSLVLGFVLSVAIGNRVWAAGDDYYDDFYKRIFANGHALIVEDGVSGNTRVKCDKNDNGTYETNETIYEGDLSDWDIFGGKKNGNVTNTKITVNGGNVDTIFAGGYVQGIDIYNDPQHANVTGVAEITVNGGKIRNISGGSDVCFGKAVVNKANIKVYAGNIGSIYANYGTAQPQSEYYVGDTNKVVEISFDIRGGTVHYVISKDDPDVTFGNVSSFIISGASVSAYDVNELPRPTSPNGTMLYRVSLTHELDGQKYANKKIDHLELGDGTKYYYNNAYTSDPDGFLYAWLPVDTKVKWSSDGSNKFVCTKRDLTIQSTLNTSGLLSAGTLSNVVVKPTVTQPVYYGSGYSDYGFINLYSSDYPPYTITGDAPRQENAGNYTTTFDLMSGLKWDDGSTGKYVVKWKINKASRYLNESDYRTNSETGYQRNDGKILGLKEYFKYEYSTDNTNWTDVADGSTDISGLAPGTYYLRIKEDANHNSSAAITLIIKAAPKPTKKLTICKHGSSEVLCEVTAEIQDSNDYKALIPEDYYDYAFFDDMNSTNTSHQIKPEYDPAIWTDTITIQNNTTIYALEPTFISKDINYSLTDNNEVSVVMGEESNDLLNNLENDSYDKYYITNYFDMLLRYKLLSNEFGDVSGLSKEEMATLYCSKTYYVIPCKVDNESVLTKSDRYIAQNYYKYIYTIPHISLNKENGAVMKINVKQVTDNGKSVYMYTFSSIENVPISDSVILDLGKYPKDHGNFVIFDSQVNNTVVKSTKFSITYGQKNVPTAIPIASSDPGAVPSAQPTSVPDTTPTAAPSTQPVPTNEPHVSDVPVKNIEKEILKADTDKADIAGSTQRFLFLKVASVKKKSIKIKWNKVSGADGYMIYGSKCGSKMKFIKDIRKSNSTSCTFKKLKKNTYYKYMVVAYKNTDSEPMVITTSKSVHAATSGGKKGNPIAIKKVKKKYTIKKGKTLKLKPAFTSKKKVSLHIAKFRYESLDESVATVSKKGKIKAVGKGETTILIYTQNGICKKVKLVVK